MTHRNHEKVERNAEMVRRYLDGEPVEQIARTFGVSGNTVHTILKRLGAKS